MTTKLRQARTREAMLASLTQSLRELEGGDDVYTEEGDALASLRDYIEDTPPPIEALSEVAFAYLAGIAHERGDAATVRPAFRALAKALEGK